MEMKYDEFVSYLLKKYGPAKYDYFTNATCKTKSKRISRTKGKRQIKQCIEK